MCNVVMQKGHVNIDTDEASRACANLLPQPLNGNNQAKALNLHSSPFNLPALEP